MSGWTAVVPIKPPGERKTRLGPRLSPDARIALSETMLAHVLAVLARCPAIAAIALLSAERPVGDAGWIEDRGGGLNAALARVAGGVATPLVVIHADLPALTPGDVDALVAAAAGTGAAIAPDRHGRGTNALALAAPRDMRFAFGPDSLARHRATLPRAALVARPGLALDVDDGEDLAAAIRLGVLHGAG